MNQRKQKSSCNTNRMHVRNFWVTNVLKNCLKDVKMSKNRIGEDNDDFLPPRGLRGKMPPPVKQIYSWPPVLASVGSFDDLETDDSRGRIESTLNYFENDSLSIFFFVSSLFSIRFFLLQFIHSFLITLILSLLPKILELFCIFFFILLSFLFRFYFIIFCIIIFCII